MRGEVNFLKTGIFYADVITTVSETYAREIQTHEYGSGLDYLLRLRRRSLVGIVNGVDYEEWSPEKDKYIPYNYSMNDLSGKEENKRALLSKLDLPYDPNAPVYGIISRLTFQKGFDLLMRTLFPMLTHKNIRFLILGSGEYKYEGFFTAAQRHFPHKVYYYPGYSNELAHLIEAGSDMFLMPSKFEPCGLNQIYSLKYGTVPIVRNTGGLADTVNLWNPPSGDGTGFVFNDFTTHGLSWAMEFGEETFKNKESWQKLMLNGMRENFSWEVQVGKYIHLYTALLGI